MNETVRIIDEEIRLIPYYPNPEEALPWYQDKDVVKQCDNSDVLYTEERLEAMYTYLFHNGDCFYIEYRGRLIGDVSLRGNGEIAIVISKPYQNNHIGRRCIRNILQLAKEKGFETVTAVIYSFNRQSQKAFEACGFRKIEEEKYVFSLEDL